MAVRQINRAAKELDGIRAEYLAKAASRVAQLMTEIGVTMDDLRMFMDAQASTKAKSKDAKGDASQNKQPKPGNYPRGVQPPKYQDPKSGATWSGRGRAPGWIANTRNRDKFLIASE